MYRYQQIAAYMKEGHGYQETAKKFGVTTQTIYGAMHRARTSTRVDAKSRSHEIAEFLKTNTQEEAAAHFKISLRQVKNAAYYVAHPEKYRYRPKENRAGHVARKHNRLFYLARELDRQILEEIHATRTITAMQRHALILIHEINTGED
jgi:transposase-like protein